MGLQLVVEFQVQTARVSPLAYDAIFDRKDAPTEAYRLSKRYNCRPICITFDNSELTATACDSRGAMNRFTNLWNDERGQDLIEYTLLMAFVALAAAGLFLGAGGNVKGMWVATNSQLAVANTKAS